MKFYVSALVCVLIKEIGFHFLPHFHYKHKNLINAYAISSIVVYKHSGILNTINGAFWTFLDFKPTSMFHYKRTTLFIH